MYELVSQKASKKPRAYSEHGSTWYIDMRAAINALNIVSSGRNSRWLACPSQRSEDLRTEQHRRASLVLLSRSGQAPRGRFLSRSGDEFFTPTRAKMTPRCPPIAELAGILSLGDLGVLGGESSQLTRGPSSQ